MIKYTVEVFEYGTQKWYKDGKLHREDGPAVIIGSIRQEWYRNGELHREDGPAVIDGNNYQVWYRNGELHREDGPAIIDGDYQEWWVDGKEIPPSSVKEVTMNELHKLLGYEVKIVEN